MDYFIELVVTELVGSSPSHTVFFPEAVQSCSVVLSLIFHDSLPHIICA
jgi:hypothetical protein